VSNQNQLMLAPLLWLSCKKKRLIISSRLVL
jgi:hypothetical protein